MLLHTLASNSLGSLFKTAPKIVDVATPPHQIKEMRKYKRFSFDKKHFTKSERRFGRALQELKIPFKTKIKINGREIDFLIGEEMKWVVEIDGHIQDNSKNKFLLEAGYNVTHFSNKELNNIKEWLKTKLLT